MFCHYKDDSNCCASCTVVFVPKELIEILRNIDIVLMFVPSDHLRTVEFRHLETECRC